MSLLRDHIKDLRRAHVRQVNILCCVLHVLGFCSDQSVLVILLKSLLQLIVGTKYKISELRGLNNDTGNSVTNMARSTFVLEMDLDNDDNGNDNVNGASNTATNGAISLAKRRLFIRRISSTFLVIWFMTIAYQFTFCRNDIHKDQLYNSFIGTSCKHNQEATLPLGDFYNRGSLIINIIGELKFSSSLLKMIYMVTIDLASAMFQFYLIILNIGLTMELIPDETNFDARLQSFSGNTKILTINPVEAFKFIFGINKMDLMDMYMAEMGPQRNSALGSISTMI